VNDKSWIEIARLIKFVCNKGVNGDDARIEARNLKIEARASSVQNEIPCLPAGRDTSFNNDNWSFSATLVLP
jgi:hypothetical protein